MQAPRIAPGVHEPNGLRMARNIQLMCSEIRPVTQRDLALAIDLLEAHPQIMTRDAFHAATMINHGLEKIICTDRRFDLLPGIKRIDPMGRRGVASDGPD